MTDISHFIPQFALTRDGHFLPWEDYLTLQEIQDLKSNNLKRVYLIKISSNTIYINDVKFAEKTKRDSAKVIYGPNDTRSFVIYNIGGWAKMNTCNESIVGFLV